MTYDPADHTIDEVHEHLEAHPEDTDAVLAAEQARGDDARVTLVADLERKAKPDNGASAEQEAAESTEKFDDGVPHGEYPTEGTFGYDDKTVAESDAEFAGSE
ncbi:MAG TPA: hypothetical protein VFP09_06385 [Desertimonas sp.]|nr:hypothetical protein [Desertimonas sp.]